MICFVSHAKQKTNRHGRHSMQHRIPPDTTINALLIGTGGQGLRRGEAVRLSKGWNLTGIYDLDPNQTHRMASQWKCNSFHDLKSAIGQADTDVVLIATPPSSHDALIEMALESGKHVLCEKPLTVHPDSAFRLANKAERLGLILATGFNHRFYGPVLDASAIIQNHTFGKLIQIDARIGEKPSEQALNGWLGNYEISGGGVLTDNGSHLIDLLHLFMGEIMEINHAEIQWDPNRPNIEPFAKAEMKSREAIKCCLECNWLESHAPYLVMELQFETGSLKLSAFPWRLEILPANGKLKTRLYWMDRIRMKFLGLKSPGLEPSLMRELNAFRNQVIGMKPRGSEVCIATGQDGARAAKVVSDIRSAAQ